jgi:hypothetical protein
MKEMASDTGQASTPHGASLRVSTTASAGGSRARLLCPRYGLPITWTEEDCCRREDIERSTEGLMDLMDQG